MTEATTGPTLSHTAHMATPSHQPLTPCLWFDHQAEDAAKFYTSIFPNSSIGYTSHYAESSTEASGKPAGSVMTVTFTIAGQEFLALNGGPVFQFSPAISFMINCSTQEEIDYYWEKLLEGGSPMECGWLNDKFGLSWQVVPVELMQMIKEPDPVKFDRVMARMHQMVKLDLEELRKAYNG